MSIRQMSRVWDESPYRGDRLLLHLALADFANDSGVAFPSQAVLAHKARCSVKWVYLTMKLMVEDGQIEQLAPPAGRGHPGQWKLLEKPGTKPGTEFGVSDVNPELQDAKPGTPTISVLLDEPSRTIKNRVSEFETWYDEYPIHKARGDAEKAWRQTNGSLPELSVLLAATRLYAKSDLVSRGFGKHPATWLRSKSWLDEEEHRNGDGPSFPLCPSCHAGWAEGGTCFSKTCPMLTKELA